MKTEIDRICGIMYTLLEHQPVIDVPYEKINDIAVALVKEGYGDISEYKAEIERLRQEVRDTDKMARNTIEQYKNNYDNAFERLKSQGREIGKLKEENETLKNDLINSEGNLNHITTEFKQLQTNAEILARGVRDLNHENYELTEKIKQAQIDVLNKVKDIVFDYLGVKNIKEAEALSLLDSTLTYDVVTCGIDEIIKEVQDE